MAISPPIVVVCAVILRDDRVLLARRPEGKRLAGFWEFPGGKVEPEESPPEALHRELQEELGCRVVIRRRLPPVRHGYEWGSIDLHPFVCELTSGSPDPHPHEHAELVWASVLELSGYELAPADQPVVEALWGDARSLMGDRGKNLKNQE